MATTPPTAGVKGFLKSQAKFQYAGIGLPFAALDIKNIIESDHKFIALLKTFKDLVVAKVAMVGVFLAISAAVRTLVRETGSLKAALDKLSQGQAVARSLSPLLGGVNAGRQRAAELQTLAKRGPFSLEETAGASRSLEVSTRGSFSSTRATQQIGKAAIASGNNITDVAQAVGAFYTNLREGHPIEAASEQLRQLGVVSQADVDHLNKLANGGAGLSTTFGALTTLVETAGTGIKEFGDDVATVTAEFEKAKTSLAEKFGAPWTEADVQTTKNLTAAYTAIGPAVGSVSVFLEKIFSGFSTAGSAILKFAAQGGVAGKAIEIIGKGLGIAAVAALLYGTAAMPALISATIGAIGGFTALNGVIGVTAASTLATVASVAAMATGVGLMVVAVVAATGIVYNFVKSINETNKRIEDFAKAHQQASSSLAGHAAAIKTLTDRNEVLAESMQRIIDLEKERQELLASRKDVKGISDIIEVSKKLSINQESINKAKASRNVAAEQTQVGSPERKAALIAQEERKRNVLVQESEAEMANATPERRLTLLKQQREAEQAIQGEALAGERATLDIAEKRSKFAKPIEDQQVKRVIAEEKLKSSDIDPISKHFLTRSAGKAADEAARLQGEQLRVGLNAPESSATFAETKAEQMRQAGIAEKLTAEGKPQEAVRARTIAGGVKFNARELEKLEVTAEVKRGQESKTGQFGAEDQARKAQIDAATLELRLTQSRAGLEENIAMLKSEGVARAQDEYDLKQKQISDEIDLLAKQKQPNSAALKELYGRSEALSREKQFQDRDVKITESRAESEKQISELKSEGPERAAEEFAISQKQAQTEIDLLKKGPKTPETDSQIKGLEAKKKEDIRAEQFRLREIKITDTKVVAETKIADLRSHGADRTEEEYKIKQNQIAEEVKIIESGPRTAEDDERVKSLKAEGKLEDQRKSDRTREAKVERTGIETQLTGAAARRRGDIATAQRSESLESFSKHFEELLPTLGEGEAKDTAGKLAGSEIADQYQQAQRVVSSLQSIGGGGGTSQIDPAAEIAKRQEQLQRDMVTYLKKIAEGDDPAMIPTFQ